MGLFSNFLIFLNNCLRIQHLWQLQAYYSSDTVLQQSVSVDNSMEQVPKEKTAVQNVTVDGTEAGRRLDNFLSSRFRQVPRSRVYSMVRRGEVRVNGSRARQDYRLRDGDVVRIPPLRLPSVAQPQPVPATAIARLQACVLFEDERLIALNKPAGLAVHGGSGIDYGVIEILRAARSGDDRIELVHRLDRDTSGCLLLAKDMVLLRSLHEQLQSGRIHKHYVALLKGQLGRRSLEIAEPLRKNRPRTGERRVVTDADGKASATRICRRRLYTDATLVEVELLTGRTHQIRVHAAAYGAPLAGDRKYGDAGFNQFMRRLGLRRLFLHAASLELPALGLRIEAPLPDALIEVLEKLAQRCL